MANHEIELQVAPMSDETMDYLDTLFSVWCFFIGCIFLNQYSVFI